METALLIIIPVTVIAILLSIILWIRLRLTRLRLNSLADKVIRMANTQPDHQHRKTITGKQVELDTTLELLSTKLLELESNLNNEREQLSTILNAISAGIVLLDRERQVLTLNQAASRLFKPTAGSVLGQPFINLSHDHEMDDIVLACLKTQSQKTGMVQPVGTKLHLEIIATPFRNGALLLVNDLTNIRRLEKIRQDFIANISHELRTPVASCKAIVETLQNGALNDKKVAEDFLQRMQVETDKLTQMISELGELSRIESGELILKLEPVNIATLINKVISRLKTQADRARLNVIISIPQDLPQVPADIDRIEQVIVNIVHNAIKFTPKKGKITIGSEVKNNYLFVSISDTGTGIPDDDLPHIFERFYKVDKARSGGGTGLGLSIAKHIIRAHGGDIRVESVEGRGSTFIFSLPLTTS
jgi:two-component system phosphate regulon sensor histidine kinase PhoR